jgi:hypothetical protein
MTVATSQLGPEQDAVVLGGEMIPVESLVDAAQLRGGDAHRDRFAHAEPFPHIVFENLFSPRLLMQIVAEFEAKGKAQWMEIKSEGEHTRRSRPASVLGPATQTYFDILSSGRFVQFLQAVSGIAGLVPDPMLRGGGMHESKPGGMFDLHLDFEKHPVTLLDNRLVFITYLNPGWRKEWGGCLELWDMAANRSVKEIVPEFGRSILFCHSDKSLHGHPHPVETPDGRPRRSVAAYYYSNGREDGLAAQRFSTFFAPKPVRPVRDAVGKVARAVTPPIVYTALKRLKPRKPSGPS